MRMKIDCRNYVAFILNKLYSNLSINPVNYIMNCMQFYEFRNGDANTNINLSTKPYFSLTIFVISIILRLQFNDYIK